MNMKTILAALGIFFVIAVIYAMGKNDTKGIMTSPPTNQYQTGQTIPTPTPDGEQAYKTAFMNECAKSGQTTYCDCTYTHLRSNYTLAQIAAMGIDYTDTKVMPYGMEQAIKSCLNFIQDGNTTTN